MSGTYKAGYAKIDWSVPLPAPEKPVDYVARSDLACPRFISDTMEPASHVDGNFYSSKSAYRAVTKAHGYVEVGNDPSRLRQAAPVKDDPALRHAAVQKAIATTLGS
jgi:hypothetical protein